MATYVVHARIDGVRPRRRERRLPGADVVERGRAVAVDDLDTRHPDDDRGVDWERIREIWAQTTFYLFDPSSWR